MTAGGGEDVLALVRAFVEGLIKERVLSIEEKELSLHERKNPPRTTNGLWPWLGANASVLSTFLTMLALISGGLWTVNVFVTQEHDKLVESMKTDAFQKQTMMVQFYGQLGDKNKRNTAAYALAALGGPDSVPMLILTLREAVSSGDTSFMGAVIQSIISVDPPSVGPVLDLNHQAQFEQNNKLIVATQQIIRHFMLNSASQLAAYGVSFYNINLAQAQLIGWDAHGLNLEFVNLSGANLSGANLTGADLRGAILLDAKMDHANLTDANLRKAVVLPGQLNTALLRNTLMPDGSVHR